MKKDIIEEMLSIAEKRWEDTAPAPTGPDVTTIANVALAQMSEPGWQVAAIHAVHCKEAQAYYVTLWRVISHDGVNAIVQLQGMLLQYDEKSNSYIVQISRKLT